MPGPLASAPRRRIARRRSRIAGWGVYAGERITKNSRIVQYVGERISHAESAKREKRQLPRGMIWCFTVNRRVVVDASVGGNVARFINHSCRPNCWFEVVDRTIWIRASRLIRAGEELTYDYATVGERTIPCRCRPGCPNML